MATIWFDTSAPARRAGHGSVVALRDWTLGVEVGLPSPPGVIPVMPKYVPCRGGPWASAGASFCRIISVYGPRGLSESLERLGLRQTYDPAYGAPMPYVSQEQVVAYVSPRGALARVLRGGSPLGPSLARVVEAVAREVGGSDLVGLTGSIAMGVEQPFSDIDLVIYGGEGSERAFDLFVRRAEPVAPTRGEEQNYGGVVVRAAFPAQWRRGLLKDLAGVPVSWVGVPMDVASHCGPLRSRQGLGPHKVPVSGLVLTVQPGQEGALLYPPCVRAEEGVHLVSYEFNLGAALYLGGVFRVDGISFGGTLVLGARELPGSLVKLKEYRR